MEYDINYHINILLLDIYYIFKDTHAIKFLLTQ